MTYARNRKGIVQAFSEGKQDWSVGNIHIINGVLYSYGTHFPLAVKNTKGNSPLYILNGDTYSNSTSQHQWECRQQLTPNVQIPMSILRLIGANVQIPMSIHRVIGMQNIDVARDLIVIDHESDRTDMVTRTRRNDAGEKESYEAEVHFLGEVLFSFVGKYYLSGFDRNEAGTCHERESYFCAQLPRKATSVADALDSLKPAAVTGDHKRQGEWFFVPTQKKTADLQPIPDLTTTIKNTVIVRKEFTARKDYNDKIRYALSLAYGIKGTDNEAYHAVREIRRDTEGIYARGTVRHGEHMTLNLGNIWHSIYKNTAVRSWAGSGAID